MPHLFHAIEGFETAKTVAELQHKWSGSLFNSPTFVAGRLHGTAISGSNANSFMHFSTEDGVAKTFIHIGGGWFFNKPASEGIVLQGIIVGTGLPQFTLRTVPQGGGGYKLRLQRGNSVEIGLTTTVFLDSTWYHIELFVDCKTTAVGSFELRVNENTELSGTNVQTVPDGSIDLALCNVVHDGTGGAVARMDDLFFEGHATMDQGFVGDQVIEGVLPNANGDLNQMTVVGAASNFQAVDEPDENDGDTSYVQTNQDNQTEWYEFGNLAFIQGDITCIQAQSSQRLAASGTRNMQLGVRRSATEAFSGNLAIDTTSYKSRRLIQRTDPILPGAWTLANFNATQFGFRTVV